VLEKFSIKKSAHQETNTALLDMSYLNSAGRRIDAVATESTSCLRLQGCSDLKLHSYWISFLDVDRIRAAEKIAL
jgi:hypothetical protein